MNHIDKSVLVSFQEWNNFKNNFVVETARNGY